LKGCRWQGFSERKEDTPMTGQVQPRRRGSYGIDAPYAPTLIAAMIVVVLVLAIISGSVWPFRGTRHHQAQLAKIGMSDVTRRRLGWRFWWGGPWAATRLVTATKPERRT
jgi:hypothetical protein